MTGDGLSGDGSGVAWSAPRPGAPCPLVDVIGLHGRYLADKPAVVSAGQTVTYGGLAAGVDRLAGGLADRGISAGDRVGVALQPSALHVAVLLGLWQLGAVACPLNTRLAGEELAAYGQRLSLAPVIVDPANARAAGSAPALAVAGAEVPFAEAVAALGPAPVPPPTSPPEAGVAMALPTGGTTGIPKAALWGGAAIGAVVASNCIHLGVSRDDRELYLSPMFHIAVLTGLFAPLYVGATVHLASPSEPGAVLDALARGGITRLFAVPTVLERLLAARSADLAEGLDGVRSVVFGASPSADDLVRRLRRLFPGAGVFTGYGATEFGPVTRAYPSELAGGGDVGVGRPVAGVGIWVVGADGQPVDDGEPGEVMVRSPWQMLGYAGSEDDPWWGPGAIRSGDIGLLRHGYLHLRGRAKELIKSGGEQVFPLDVERVVLSHPSVSAAAVYGVTDRLWGERVECAVVVSDGCPASPEELAAHCRRHLAGFETPKRFVFVDELPLTAAGKVDRRALAREASGA